MVKEKLASCRSSELNVSICFCYGHYNSNWQPTNLACQSGLYCISFIGGRQKQENKIKCRLPNPFDYHWVNCMEKNHFSEISSFMFLRRKSHTGRSNSVFL